MVKSKRIEPSYVQREPDGKDLSQLAPVLAPNLDKACKSLSSVVKMTADEPCVENDGPIDLSAYAVIRKEPLSTADNGLFGVGDEGLEPPTSTV